MGNRWLFLPLVIFMFGCALEIYDDDYESIAMWVRDYLTYVPNTDWNTPEQILDSRVGDCKNFATLMLWKVHEEYGVKGFGIAIRNVDNHELGHALVLLDTYYDPTHGSRLESVPDGWEVYRVLSYDACMFWSAIL